MDEGRLNLTISPVPLARPSLEFLTDDGRRVPIMSMIELPAACRCAECKTTVICGKDGTEAECLSCGEFMAPGQTMCASCGWTYYQTASH